MAASKIAGLRPRFIWPICSYSQATSSKQERPSQAGAAGRPVEQIKAIASRHTAAESAATSLLARNMNCLARAAGPAPVTLLAAVYLLAGLLQKSQSSSRDGHRRAEQSVRRAGQSAAGQRPGGAGRRPKIRPEKPVGPAQAKQGRVSQKPRQSDVATVALQL